MVGNLIVDFYDRLQQVAALGPGATVADGFSPAFALPELDEGLRRFYRWTDANYTGDAGK